MPKCYWLPFLIWRISEVRLPSLFWAELGAAISVAPTTVPSLGRHGASIIPMALASPQTGSEQANTKAKHVLPVLGDALIYPVWQSFETKPAAL